MKTFNHKNEKPKNDIQYYRVSSNEQVLGFSLDNQEKFCREMSSKDGYNVFKTWREEGESAKTADRTQLQLMMRFCEQHKKQIARLVVYKVDRLSRNTADYLALKAFFNKLGIIVVSATEKLEDTPGGKFYETLLSAAAEFDNNVRSQRTIEGMKARLVKGLWSGIAPWGYKNVKDTLGNKLIAPDPERTDVVKMLFEQKATGKYSFKELANMANKLGHKSRHGMKMSKQLVAKIIKNPIYCGKIVVPKFGISTQGSHRPIISEKLFEEANSENKGIEGRKLPRNKDSPDYPLRGIKCGGCGKSISGGKTKGKTKYYQYYGCFNSACEKRHAIKKEDMEEDFTKFLLELTPNENFFEALKEAIRLAHGVELNSTKATERKLTAKITELKSEKEELLNLRIKGKISDEDFTPANEKYRFKISELEKEVASLSTPELEVDNVIDSSVEFLKHLPENWKTLDVKDLRVLRTLLFPKNLIYSYPTIKTLELCCIYNIKSEFLDEKNRFVTLQRIEL
ncbi:MAG: Site-specific recombinase [Candidatus Doudnabacteria bacterium Gr01-1014_77]|uniref:Site-specific recombinase n=1 Tax=Candidatus Doudnabacteria bacterium Gr01-1014_77 TaxID=2017133 RepID=A0A554JAC6_9BACT|nr:MAG: Site-specific recombinase [Candidatus Doudnabacteria bacterium Gr01-1014_77]